MLAKSFLQSAFLLGLAAVQIFQAIPTFQVPWLSSSIGRESSRAVFQTNERNNSIVTLKINENGPLCKEFITSTWGKVPVQLVVPPISQQALMD